jgi:hypothetical protein
MRKVFTALVSFVMLAVVVQFALAASGAFDTAPKDESFQPHRVLGYAILLLAVVVTALAALLRMPGRIIGLSGLVAGLTILQPVIVAVADALGHGESSSTAGEIVFGLHAVNALLIFSVLRMIIQSTRRLSSTAPTGGTEDEGPPAGRPPAGGPWALRRQHGGTR